MKAIKVKKRYVPPISEVVQGTPADHVLEAKNSYEIRDKKGKIIIHADIKMENPTEIDAKGYHAWDNYNESLWDD